MPKRSSTPKKAKDREPQQIARSILDQIAPDAEPVKPEKAKNPAAVALGRLGGLKGGKARAASLSAAKRNEITKEWRNNKCRNHLRQGKILVHPSGN